MAAWSQCGDCVRDGQTRTAKDFRAREADQGEGLSRGYPGIIG